MMCLRFSILFWLCCSPKKYYLKYSKGCVHCISLVVSLKNLFKQSNCTLKNSFVYEYYERFHPENYKASKIIIILKHMCCCCRLCCCAVSKE